jgi:hypothetical protein
MNGRHREKWAQVITFGKDKSMFKSAEEAMAYAVNLAPSATNKIAVVCMDAGSYTPESRTVADPLGLGTDDTGNSFTVPAHVKFFAPNLVINGRIYVEANSFVNVSEIVPEDGSGDMYQQSCIIAADGDATNPAIVFADKVSGIPYIAGGATTSAAVLEAHVSYRSGDPEVYDDAVLRENGYRFYMADFAAASALFDAAGLTDNATVLTQPANSELIAVKMILKTQFDSYTSCSVEVGLAGDENGLIADTVDLVSDAVDTEYTARGAYVDGPTEGLYFAASAVEWKAYATAIGANLDTATVGNLRFIMKVKELSI